jgi:hypothetical protein
MKRGKQKSERVLIKPRFLQQIRIPESRILKSIAKYKHSTPEDEAKSMMHRRLDVSKKNTGIFYIHLYHGIFGGQICKEDGEYVDSIPLFSENSGLKFFPDIIIKKHKDFYVEVKSSSKNHNRPWFGKRQVKDYFTGIIENQHSDMLAGIFRYGDRHTQKLHVCKDKNHRRCDNSCFVEKLSHSTKDLIVLPHNLLTFLLVISRIEDMDQSTSTNNSSSEKYFRPYGSWISLLHKHYKNPIEAIDGIILNNEKKYSKFTNIFKKQEITLEKAKNHLELILDEMKLKDFFFEELEARQYSSPDNLYCRNYNVRPFTVTYYSNKQPDEWREYFIKNKNNIANRLGIDLKSDLEKENEQRAKQGLPKKPNDDIPF